MNTTNFNNNPPEDLYYKLSPINMSGFTSQSLPLPSISKSMPIHKLGQKENQKTINLVHLYNEKLNKQNNNSNNLVHIYNEKLNKLSNDSNNATVNSNVNNDITLTTEPSIYKQKPFKKKMNQLLNTLMNNCSPEIKWFEGDNFEKALLIYDKAVECLNLKDKIEENDKNKIIKSFEHQFKLFKKRNKREVKYKKIDTFRLKRNFFQDISIINNNNDDNDNVSGHRFYINNKPTPTIFLNTVKPKQDTLSALINNCYKDFDFDSNPNQNFVIRETLYEKAVELLDFKNKIEPKDETKIKNVFSRSISKLKCKRQYNKNIKEINLINLKKYYFKNISIVNNNSFTRNNTVNNNNIIINNNNNIIDINNNFKPVKLSNHKINSRKKRIIKTGVNDIIIALINNCYNNFSFELYNNSRIKDSIYEKSIELLNYKNKIDPIYEKQIKDCFDYSIRQLKYKKNYNQDSKEINLVQLKEYFFKDIPILGEQINVQTEDLNLESINNINLLNEQDTITKVVKALIYEFKKKNGFSNDSNKWNNYFLFALKLLDEKEQNISPKHKRKVIERMQSVIIKGRDDEFDKVDTEALRKFLFNGVTFKTQIPTEFKNEVNNVIDLTD
jgi:hypothetical protein